MGILPGHRFLRKRRGYALFMIFQCRNNSRYHDTLRALTPIFGRNSLPSSQAVRAVVTKFETTYSLLDDSESLDESDTDAEPVIESPGKKRAVGDEEAPPVKRAKGRPPQKKAKDKKESDDESDNDEDDVQKESSDEAGSS